MFNSVIVATDVDAGADPAIPVGVALASRGRLAIEVLTVVSARGGLDDDERRRRLSAHGLGESLCVVHGDDVARAIVDHVQNRDGALLVMSTRATGLISERLRRSVSAHVLSELRQPVLLVGPAVPEPVRLASPTLVACTDRSQDGDAALPVVVSWQRTFGGGRPWVVEVKPTTAWPAGTIDDIVEREHVDAAAAVLADHGVEASTQVLHGGDPVLWLLEFADGVDDAVFVATSARWSGGRSHWYSTTRRLVHRSPRPVLVVPADLAGY